MFEDSLMESQHRLTSPNQRWTTLVSLALQCLLVAAIVAIPLLHPEVLPFHADVPKIVLQLKPVKMTTPKLSTLRSMAANSFSPTASRAFIAPTTIHPLTQDPGEAPSIGTSASIPWGTGETGIPGAAIGNATSPHIAAITATKSSPVRVSQGVSAGLLLAPIRPVYPRIALSTRTEGTVTVEAIISKSGTIESIHSTSGPELLRIAAIDAIRNARYSPYLLNGAPTEVETTITVTFRLAS